MATFKQVFGTSSDNEITTEPINEIIFPGAGNDTIIADFQSIDYIIDTSGDNDILLTGGNFATFTIAPHAGVQGAYLVRNTATGKANLIKGIESFGFTEGTASLDDFMNGKAPVSIVFDKIIGIDQFQENSYQAQDGVAEQFQINLDLWQMSLSIDGFNASEDQLVIVKENYTIEQFIAENLAGAAGAWGWDATGNLHVYNPNFAEIALFGISEADGESIYSAVEEGWLKFGTVEDGPEPEVLQITMEHFQNYIYTATNASEVITITMAEWQQNITINNFDAVHDKLVIDGDFASAQEFIDANVAGASGAWAYDAQGGAHIFNPDFAEITLAGITGAGNASLLQAEAAGWIEFV